MFERFTERARQVVVFAQEEARALRHNYIGTEHLLLGLLREREGLAARVLDSLDVTVEEVRAQVAGIIGQGEEVAGQIPFTPRSKKVLELSLREAISLKHNYIGTEHILLGLVRENEGVAARILLDFDADTETIRNEIFRMLSGPGRRTLTDPRPPAMQSPPFAPEVGQELARLRDEKEAALEQQRFAQAAVLRDRERRLSRAASRFAQEWEDRERPAAPPDVAETVSFGESPSRDRGSRFPLPAVALGWLLFAVAFAIGVAVGLAASA